MQKRYLLVLGTFAGAALFSAQQGPACPYDHAHATAAQPANTGDVSYGAPADGSPLGFARSEAFAP